MIQTLWIAVFCLLSPPISADLREDVDSAFQPQKTTVELIQIATEQAPEDNLSSNIRARAYIYLDHKLADPRARKLILKSQAAFLKTWRETRTDFVRTVIADFLMKLSLSPRERSEVLLSQLEEARMPLDLPSLQKQERALLPRLRSLAQSPDKKQNLPKVLRLIEGKFYLSKALVLESLNLVEAWLRDLSQAEVDRVVQARFQFARLIDEHKKRQEQSQNSPTIWLHASAAEVSGLLKKFDQVACSRPFKAGQKSWHYDYIVSARSETRFLDVHQRLECAK